MLAALVLICSVTATPDLSACTRDNAVTVLQVPGQWGVPATCFLHGQDYLAETSIGRDLAPDERVKIMCAPVRSARR